MQVAVAPEPERPHVPLKVPVPLVDKETEPVGVMGSPTLMLTVSVTATVHVEGALAVIGVLQDMLVVVLRRLTVTMKGVTVEAALWVESPA